jgi:tetraacyldisaccharide 4'-kinase
MAGNLFYCILVSPLALIYGAIVNLRAFSYRTGLLRSSRFDVPVIVVGNLSTGGAGKSPHTEYLVRLLEPYISVAILSRGYKRKTEGFRMVELDDTALDVGDEPLQFKRKYPSVPVAVGERRAYAIPQIIYRHPTIQAIILDDAFQHYAVRPYFRLLVTEYNRPFTRDYLLPMGNLREGRWTYLRADIIVVSKCPTDLQTIDKQKFIAEIHPTENQRVYFSYYAYGKPYPILAAASSPYFESWNTDVPTDLDAETDVLLITGIARTDYLLEHLSQKVKSVTTFAFEDHRVFTNYDVAHLKKLFDQMASRKKIILTTEKDATRLELHREYLERNQVEIYALPIEVQFLFGEGSQFDADIKQRLLDFKV